jgi:hypothetical protein
MRMQTKSAFNKAANAKSSGFEVARRARQWLKTRIIAMLNQKVAARRPPPSIWRSAGEMGRRVPDRSDPQSHLTLHLGLIREDQSQRRPAD